MGSCRRCKSVSDPNRDLISQLPADVKDKILEYLPIGVAVRTSVLSTHWRDVWLHHGRLVFDMEFFSAVRFYTKRRNGDECKAAVNIINNILMHRAGTVKKFTLFIYIICSNLRLEHSVMDRWLIFLSRKGIEELSISVEEEPRYKLPDCILSCSTIKQLKLESFQIGFPVNTRIFPNVTALCLSNVEFEPNVHGIVSTLGNLEVLAFRDCIGMDSFEIRARKLQSMYVIGCFDEAEWRWFTHHWQKINTLWSSPTLLSLIPPAVIDTQMKIPTAINLQVITLSPFDFSSRDYIICVTVLLRNSPNLRELEFEIDQDCFNSDDEVDEEAASRLLVDPYFISHDLKMLKTVKIEWFTGSEHEMLFVKAILSKSPVLEKIVLRLEHYVGLPNAFEITRELLGFPRASPKAQVVFEQCESPHPLVNLPIWFSGFVTDFRC